MCVLLGSASGMVRVTSIMMRPWKLPSPLTTTRSTGGSIGSSNPLAQLSELLLTRQPLRKGLVLRLPGQRQAPVRHRPTEEPRGLIGLGERNMPPRRLAAFSRRAGQRLRLVPFPPVEMEGQQRKQEPRSPPPIPIGGKSLQPISKQPRLAGRISSRAHPAGEREYAASRQIRCVEQGLRIH